MFFSMLGCSLPVIDTPNTDNSTEETTQKPLITYEVAFQYIKKSEDNIIGSNQYNYNKYGENAAEKLIYSDEYAMLYCSYWKTLELLEGEHDSRFEKSKMRWQYDYSNEEWTSCLVEALKNNGIEAFQDEYYRLYNEEVFPKVEYRWQNGID
jgi:hypothetical protein